jgi:hypothetical protein
MSKHLSSRRRSRALLPFAAVAFGLAVLTPAHAQGPAASPPNELETKYSSGDYRQIATLPDELMTVVDPNVVGHTMRYQSPLINDSSFVTTKTYSLSWEAQGLGALRRGAVWYRHRFTLPAELKGKPVGLLLGGYQDEARVWVNGKIVGTSGEIAASAKGMSGPAAFDLTDGINYDDPNLIAIQVLRLGDDTTARKGGLLRQSFLFTGPRLAKKANKPLELRRVLPNGEMGDLIE